MCGEVHQECFSITIANWNLHFMADLPLPTHPHRVHTTKRTHFIISRYHSGELARLGLWMTIHGRLAGLASCTLCGAVVGPLNAKVNGATNRFRWQIENVSRGFVCPFAAPICLPFLVSIVVSSSSLLVILRLYIRITANSDETVQRHDIY